MAVEATVASVSRSVGAPAGASATAQAPRNGARKTMTRSMATGFILVLTVSLSLFGANAAVASTRGPTIPASKRAMRVRGNLKPPRRLRQRLITSRCPRPRVTRRADHPPAWLQRWARLSLSKTPSEVSSDCDRATEMLPNPPHDSSTGTRAETTRAGFSLTASTARFSLPLFASAAQPAAAAEAGCGPNSGQPAGSQATPALSPGDITLSSPRTVLPRGL